MIRSRLAVAAFAFFSLASQASAQEAPTRLSYFPYFTITPNDGMMGIARAVWFQQAGWGGRIVNNRYLAIEAGYSTKDAWVGRVVWSNPTLADGWRIKALAEVGHSENFDGSDRSIDHDRRLAWVDLTRRITGPLQLAARAGIRHDDFPTIRLLEGDNSGSDPLPAWMSSPGKGTDFSFRGALVLDLRDREYDVNSGVFAELGLVSGTGGENEAYSAPYGQLKAFVTPFMPLRLTGRAGWRGTTDDASVIAPKLDFPAWEDSYQILGGHRSHRGLFTNQLAGDGVAFAGAEARFDIVNVGELGAITLLAFADAARLLHVDRPGIQGAEVVTDDDWRVGVGGGVALRVMREAVLTITASGGDGETRWYVGSGWSW